MFLDIRHALLVWWSQPVLRHPFWIWLRRLKAYSLILTRCIYCSLLLVAPRRYDAYLLAYIVNAATEVREGQFLTLALRIMYLALENLPWCFVKVSCGYLHSFELLAWVCIHCIVLQGSHSLAKFRLSKMWLSVIIGVWTFELVQKDWNSIL